MNGSSRPNMALALTGISKVFRRSIGISERVAKWINGVPVSSGVHAVADVSLSVPEEGVLALVGESGCGKSTVGRIACGIIAPTSGKVELWGEPARRESSGASRALSVQMIFQNPYDSLNPRHRVRHTIGEPALVHGLVREADLDAYVDEVMDRVGLERSLGSRRPYELSGGQCQRVGLARALSVQPRILVCDEPTSALDVSAQAQIMKLFAKLRSDRKMTYLFISHDLALVEMFSDRVAVMYLGRLVEVADTKELISHPNHPYTIALLATVPRIHKRKHKFASLDGEVPSPLNPPSGCHFHTRCPRAMQKCAVVAPDLQQIAPGHWSACHLNFREPSDGAPMDAGGRHPF